MNAPIIFDRAIKTRQRARAEKLLNGNDMLLRESALRLATTLEEEMPQTFSAALELGARGNILADMLEFPPEAYHGDEETLNVPPAHYDLVISNLALHWVNDLPGCFRRIHSALKPGGLFLATMLGGETLKELRASLLAAELALTDGTSPRISPFTLVKDAGMLLSRAGFAEPVTTGDAVTILYKDIFALMRDLRAMGETNALVNRNRVIPPRELFVLTDRFYKEKFADAEGYIPATFDIITLTGWKG